MTKERFFLLVLIGLSLLGALDAGYLTLVHFSDTPLLCGAQGSCSVVTQSAFSAVFGIPAALFGLLFYLSECAVAFLFLRYRIYALIPCMTLLAVAGVAASAWFFYVQAALLHAFCVYCLLSACITVAIAVFSGLFEREVFRGLEQSG